MEGSIFFILSLLFLSILGLPAIIPDFTGRLHFGMEKLGPDLGLFERRH
jgi:hypothetical protein